MMKNDERRDMLHSLSEQEYRDVMNVAAAMPYVTMDVKSQGKHSNLSTSVALTLKVLVTTIDAQWEGRGDVGSARYEPALLPPCPTIRVLSYSN